MTRVRQSAQRRDHDTPLANGIMITERSRYTTPQSEQDLASWAEQCNRTKYLSDTVLSSNNCNNSVECSFIYIYSKPNGSGKTKTSLLFINIILVLNKYYYVLVSRGMSEHNCMLKT